MINLATRYLGMTLRSPLVASAGPLQKDIGNIRRLEDAGCAAVVLHSLFEEQIEMESEALDASLTHGTHSFAEAIDYFPDMSAYNIGPEGYLDHIRRAKEAVRIPIIASLNGISPGGWTEYARMIEQAGADGLELNIYDLPADPATTAEQLERRYVDLVALLRRTVRIPLAVKLSPFFTSIPNIAVRLDHAGAGALVLFNRLYQPDFDLDALEVFPNLHLSRSDELLLRIHWAGVLYGHLDADMAVTGGVHSHIEVLKSLMAGATVAMMTSCLLENGIGRITEIESALLQWMEEHEYESTDQMRGSMSRRSVPDPRTYERANYMRVLGSYAVRTR
jgi:dihydroorotate dehydrogenase (fumarate)